MPYYAYILRCADGSLYSGYTNDVERRVSVHNSGKGAKYTRSRRPVSLAYCEEFPDKGSAMKRECEYKALTHAEKLLLVLQNKAVE